MGFMAHSIKKKTTTKNIEHLKKIFSSKHINKSKFKISNNLRQSDIKKGRSAVTTEEYREVINELQSIFKIFNQHKEHKSALGKTIVLEQFLSNKLIHKYTFLEKNSYNNYNIEKIISKTESCPSIKFITLLIKKIEKFFTEIEI